MDTEQILNHYRDPEFLEFYKTFYGENFMNIGIYKGSIELLEEEDDKTSFLQKGMSKKNDLLLFFIKNYINPAHTGTVILEMGGGMGGTMRNLFKIIKNARTDYGRNSEYSLYSYELSEENCSVNNLLNFEDDSRVKIYNRDFLNTFFKDESVNLIISEDTFHQVSDKNLLFNEIKRILCVNGHIIMSDVFLSEDCSDKDRQTVSELLNINSIFKQSEFVLLANTFNIELCNCLYYKKDLCIHFNVCHNIAKENEQPEKIINYFKNWVDASKYLTAGILVFKKIY
tara:strand:- start:174 stop:1028 length:855 start_codon:yes stop_codon:yes gene_type:complete